MRSEGNTIVLIAVTNGRPVAVRRRKETRERRRTALGPRKIPAGVGPPRVKGVIRAALVYPIYLRLASPGSGSAAPLFLSQNSPRKNVSGHFSPA